MYHRFFKRLVDITCALAAILVFWWLLAIVALLVRIKLGSPVIFVQKRPGLIDLRTGKEKIFSMYKFRSMTDERDAEGNYLPDEVRMTKFGKLLRSTSLDELPEVFNILKGDMSVIGPRPQLVRDMVFMTAEQRRRHTVRPGLSGLAQISGRNAISWEGKLAKDLEYIKNVSFMNDVKIVLKTVVHVLKRDGISEEGMVTSEDYGDYLLRVGKVTNKEYDDLLNKAKYLLEKC